MAYVTDIMSGPAVEVARTHRTCSAVWRRAERDGAPVLQLDTYGSPERQDQGTVSQSIQLDEENARELIAIIRSVFPSLA